MDGRITKTNILSITPRDSARLKSCGTKKLFNGKKKKSIHYHVKTREIHKEFLGKVTRKQRTIYSGVNKNQEPKKIRKLICVQNLLNVKQNIRLNL